MHKNITKKYSFAANSLIGSIEFVDEKTGKLVLQIMLFLSFQKISYVTAFTSGFYCFLFLLVYSTAFGTVCFGHKVKMRKVCPYSNRSCAYEFTYQNIYFASIFQKLKFQKSKFQKSKFQKFPKFQLKKNPDLFHTKKLLCSIFLVTISKMNLSPRAQKKMQLSIAIALSIVSL